MLNESRPPQTRVEAFLSYGFRPFFLFSMLFAVFAMALWLGWIALHWMDGELDFTTIDLPMFLWHAHEMVFGYTLAVIAGFFLTAVPGWTSTKPVSGKLLAALVMVWLGGRAVNFVSAVIPLWLTAGIDLAFTPFLLLLVMKALRQTPSKRNAIFPPILALLFVANGLTYLGRAGILDGGMKAGLTLGVNTILLLITLIGGRVVPAFTGNYLRNKGAGALPDSRLPIEMATVFFMALLIGFDLWQPGSLWTGAIAIIAALLHGLRLLGWRGWETLENPIVWILHLSYLWLIAGLALKGIAVLTGVLNEVTALHALTTGAIGSMTVAVMTRAGLGHSGREIRASTAMVAAYLMISAGALIRVAGPVFLASYYNPVMIVSGALWAGAFLILAVVFWPILTRPRKR